MTFVYLDTETTGLDPMKHEPWEVAYAVDGGPILSSFLPLDRFQNANVDSLGIGNFPRRYIWPDDWKIVDFDIALRNALAGATLVGANPSFDAAMLTHAWWGEDTPAPWHYRMLDVEVYAMGALGYEKPQGLHRLSTDLRERGHDIPVPDHTAGGDVATVRACHLVLVGMYGLAS